MLARNVRLYAPPVPAAGVPVIVPPVPDGTNETPVGSVPLKSDTVDAGKPVVVTEKAPGDPAVNVVDAALVIAGAWFTVRTKFWVPVSTPLNAEIVRG